MKTIFCPFKLLKLALSLIVSIFSIGTPLFVACQGGHIEMVRELLALGANPHVTMKVFKNESIFKTINSHSTEMYLKNLL